MQPQTGHPREVAYHLASLRRRPGIPGEITETSGDATTERFILFGLIPAGSAREHPEDVSGEDARIEDLVPGIRPGDYFLVVDGDSMCDAGLLHGQHVVIRPGLAPRNGDICAVWVDGLGNTLKRVYFEEDLITLVPANPRYQERSYPADQVRIQGVLVAALAVRSFRRL